MVEKILSVDNCWEHSVVSKDAASEKLPMPQLMVVTPKLIQATIKLTEFRNKSRKECIL